MAAHSEAPWKCQKERGNRFVVDANDNHVCTISRWSPQVDHADASLIVAAPDMLALLKELVDIDGPQPGHAEWARKVNAAIAKAEGKDHGPQG